MANYTLTDWTTRGSVEEVMAAMEIQLETVDDAKTIYLANVVKQGNEFVGVLLYAA